MKTIYTANERKTILRIYLKSLRDQIGNSKLEIRPITFGSFQFHTQRLVIMECACAKMLDSFEGIYYSPEGGFFFYSGEAPETDFGHPISTFLLEGELLEMISEELKQTLIWVASNNIPVYYWPQPENGKRKAQTP